MPSARKISTCYVCMTKHNRNPGILCNNCNKFVCRNCFEMQVQHQLDDANIGDFYKNNKKISCCNCKNCFPIVYVYDKLKKNEQFKTLNLYIKNINKKHHTKIPQMVANYSSTNVAEHCKYINEEILNLHCPSCHITFFDFDGCFAVKCNNCANYFCGWCLDGFDESHECHDHVILCKYSKQQGSYFSALEDFNCVQNQSRQKNIGSYLNKLNEVTKIKVCKEIQKNLKNLEIIMPDGVAKKVHNETLENIEYVYTMILLFFCLTIVVSCIDESMQKTQLFYVLL